MDAGGEELQTLHGGRKRGTGPRKKAVEVAEADWADHRLLQTSPREGYKVLLPAHLFACGVHWMMR